PTCISVAASLSIALCFVAGSIQVTLAISSWSTARRLPMISLALALEAGGKYACTYFCPKASPNRVSVDSTQRCARDFLSAALPRYCSRKPKDSSAKAGDSQGEAESSNCHLR